MKKYLAVLTVIGILAFGFISFAQEKPAPPAKPGQQAAAPAGPMQRLKNWLNLTPDQESKLKEFQKARQDEQQAFGDQMKKLRDELAPLMKDSKSDTNKVNGLIDQISKLQADRMKKGVLNERNLEKVFTPDQLEKLKNTRTGLRGLGMGLQMGLGMRGMGMGPGAMGQMGRGQMGPGMRGGAGQMGRGQMGMGQMGPGMRGGMGFGRGAGMMNGRGAMGPMMNRLRALVQRIRQMRRSGFWRGLGW
jgi:Spy/CpxP family protein refolding chaperone